MTIGRGILTCVFWFPDQYTSSREFCPPKAKRKGQEGVQATYFRQGRIRPHGLVEFVDRLCGSTKPQGVKGRLVPIGEAAIDASADQAPTITPGVSKNAISKMESRRHTKGKSAVYSQGKNGCVGTELLGDPANQADTWYAGLVRVRTHTHMRRYLDSWDGVL